MADQQRSLWEGVAEHALNHLAISNEKGSLNEFSELNPTQIKDLLKGSWLNAEPSTSGSKCITVKELEGYTQVVNSHTTNARCLLQDPTCTFNLVGKTGLEPIANAKSFLLAWLITTPNLPCQDKGDSKYVSLTEDKVYLRDDTGAVQCQVAVCHFDWLNRALLIPCWNVIPGADSRVQRLVEICPHCTPVVISDGTLDPHSLPSQKQQTLSAVAAAQLLQSHDSTKGRVNQVTITGTVVCKSPIMSIRNKRLFFFKMASDVSGSSSVSLLAKGSNLAFLYSALPMYSSCSVYHLTPTTILKGTRKPYHILMCRTETTVFDVQRNCGDCRHRKSITGTVTKCIDATSGIYELDGKMRLYLCYQMDDTASYQVLRAGCVVTIHNAHSHSQIGKSTMPCVVCCMQSTLAIDAFSPLDTGPKKKLIPSLSGMVRLLLKYNLSVGQFEWLSSVFAQMERKFTPTFIRQKSLHAILLRLFTAPSAISKKPLLSGRKRNIYEEFLRPSHSCLASKGSHDEQPPPWSFPAMAELLSLVEKCQEQPSKPGFMVEMRGNDVWGTGERCSSGRIQQANSLNPPMILLGYLHLNPATGRVQLRDQTGTVDCVITHICTDPQTPGPADTLTHPTQLLDAREPTECCPLKDCPSEVAPPKERKCSLPTCHHMHTWCLGHLIRVDGFLFVHEVLPLSCGGPAPEPSETCHTNNKSELDSLRGNREFVSFSMQTVKCLNCTNGLQSGSHLVKKIQDKLQKEDEARTCKAQQIPSCNHHCRTHSSLSTNNSSTYPSTGKANIKPTLQTDCCSYSSEDHLFLLLAKSQLQNGVRGSPLFIIQVAFLHGLSSKESGVSAGESEQEAPLTRPVAFVRFVGDSVRWYHTLHVSCVYRMEGEVSTVNKQEFLSTTSLSADQLKAKDHDIFLTVSHDAALDQIHVSILPEHILQRLQTLQGLYGDVLRVSSVRDVTADRTSASSSLVSFRCMIVSRKKNSTCGTHRDKKRKTCAEQIGPNPDDEFQVLVADTVDTSVTIEVYVSGAFLHNVLGLLPGATVTFRQCLRSTSGSGRVHCRVIPLSSLTIDALPSVIPSCQLVQDFPSVNEPTDMLTVPPTDNQDSSVEPAQPSILPRRYYLSCLLSHPDDISSTETFTIHCHLQAVKSLVLKWSCRRCGHKDCVCSSAANEKEGELTVTARFAVEDGTGEALVWCSEPSATAAVLGLTVQQWSQLECGIRRCKEIVYAYKRPDYREQTNMPSPTDTEGLVNLLCSHDSLQKPLVLQCHLMVWGNSNKNAKADAGQFGIAGKQYAPSVHLKCLAAYEGYH